MEDWNDVAPFHGGHREGIRHRRSYGRQLNPSSLYREQELALCAPAGGDGTPPLRKDNIGFKTDPQNTQRRKMTDSQKVIKVVTPAPVLRSSSATEGGKAGVQKSLVFLDSGPFDKLRVPSLSRDFRWNDEIEVTSLHYCHFERRREILRCSLIIKISPFGRDDTLLMGHYTMHSKHSSRRP
jgi:hypothetical protein